MQQKGLKARTRVHYLREGGRERHIFRQSVPSRRLINVSDITKKQDFQLVCTLLHLRVRGS